MIKIIDGDLFDSKANIIGHCCNNHGAFKSGVAKEVRERYPHVYSSYYNDYQNGLLQLGYVNFTTAKQDQVIANMIAQDGYGYDGKQYINYDSFQKCLNEIMNFAYHTYDIKPVIAFPYHVGCCRAGGDWNVVYKMIEDTFEDFDVEIWRLDNG